MIDDLKKVHELTLQLQKLLEDPISSGEREVVIEQLNELIEERGKYMEHISPPYTDEEKHLGERIFRMNVDIQAKMQHIFSDLKLEMKRMKKQKKTQQSYINPYKNVSSSDGSFLDKKK
ncbi:flagellar protein FliT [Oceanobacillus luteolus]|uniref:Flagellar protein FliT n=1 Tax=Oceanobacillus luteolus TaxID=1274358 RepID=A0ABW4HPB4_9BACI|nr:flagellar protein FliT [Oceanobacillus luteolus]MCM3740220.1 flagellar protein FliT [Oceanobacillus luteolus]